MKKSIAVSLCFVFLSFLFIAQEPLAAENTWRIGTILPLTGPNSKNGIKNFDDGGITPPISYGAGNHDPLKCLQWLHNTNGQWKTTSGWNCF